MGRFSVGSVANEKTDLVISPLYRPMLAQARKRTSTDQALACYTATVTNEKNNVHAVYTTWFLRAAQHRIHREYCDLKMCEMFGTQTKLFTLIEKKSV